MNHNVPRDELVAADPFADVDVVPVHLLDLVVLRTVVCISDVRGSGLGWVREDGGLTGRPRAKRPHMDGFYSQVLVQIVGGVTLERRVIAPRY